MKKIPLNSIVFLLDVTTQQVAHWFPNHEFLTIDLIRQSLIGAATRTDLKELLFLELERTAFLKLSLGQRVVVDATKMKRDQRLHMIRSAANLGHSVFTVVDNVQLRKEIQQGDRISDIIDLTQAAEVIQLLPDDNFFTSIKARGFSGVTVIPDIHGMMTSFRNAVSWARNRKHFMLFLGDLLDYGNDTLEVVEEAYQLVVRGEAEVLLGNHERKIFRYLAQSDKSAAALNRLSYGNKVTINQLGLLSKFDKERWINKFNALVHLMRSHRVAENFIFAHGAVNSEMWSNTDYRLFGFLENLTLFGEVDNHIKKADGYPNRIYNWVDDLKTGQTAIVGHDIRGEFKPFTQISARGGKAIFLDTGCGKGGHLSTVDIRFGKNETYVENFNIH